VQNFTIRTFKSRPDSLACPTGNLPPVRPVRSMAGRGLIQET
jgi:hypothetical protein